MLSYGLLSLEYQCKIDFESWFALISATRSDEIFAGSIKKLPPDNSGLLTNFSS